MVELTRARYNLSISHEEWDWSLLNEYIEAGLDDRLAHDELQHPAPPIDRKEPHALDPG